MELISLYWVEFLTIATVHLLAVASPGPDFAVVLKHSVSFGRRAGVITAIGVAVGILVHVAYSLLGIGFLIQTTPWLFKTVSLLGAGYLIYIGVSALRSQPTGPDSVSTSSSSAAISDKKAFGVGFLTNGLNPKATLFFLSLFAVVISPETPHTVKGVYGIYFVFATGAWFCFLAYVLGSQKVRSFIGSNSHWFDRIMGLALILLALKLLMSSF